MHKKRYSFWNDGDKGEQGDGKCKTTFIEQKSSDSSHSGYRITLYWWNVQGHQALRNAGVWTDNWNTAVLCHTHDCWTLDTWHAWLLNFGHVKEMSNTCVVFPTTFGMWTREIWVISVTRERETEKCFIKSCFTRPSSASIIRFSDKSTGKWAFFLSANWELKIYCRLTNWNCDLKLSWNIKQMEF